MKKFTFATLALAAAMALTPAVKANTITYGFTGHDGEVGELILSGTISGNEVTGITSGSLVIFGGTNICPVNSPNCVSGAPFSIGTYALNTVTSLPSPPNFEDPSDGFELLQFALPAGASSLYISNDGTTIDLVEDGATFQNNNDPLAVVATPEPSSLMLLGTGLMLLAGGLIWNSKGRTTSSANNNMSAA